MAHILLIDDDNAVRTILREVLARLGHTVIEARDGEEGLELFAGTAPDLVITDMVMPRKSGLEVVRVLRERQPRLKIIAMSGGSRSDPGDPLHLAGLIGATGLLSKPFTLPVLRAAIHEVLQAETSTVAGG